MSLNSSIVSWRNNNDPLLAKFVSSQVNLLTLFGVLSRSWHSAKFGSARNRRCLMTENESICHKHKHALLLLVELCISFDFLYTLFYRIFLIGCAYIYLHADLFNIWFEEPRLRWLTIFGYSHNFLEQQTDIQL